MTRPWMRGNGNSLKSVETCLMRNHFKIIPLLIDVFLKNINFFLTIWSGIAMKNVVLPLIGFRFSWPGSPAKVGLRSAIN